MATLTGTVGFEAIVRSKPVLTLVTMVSSCEGSLPVHKLKDVRDYLQKLNMGLSPTKKGQKIYQALEDVSVKAFVEPYYEKEWIISRMLQTFHMQFNHLLKTIPQIEDS